MQGRTGHATLGLNGGGLLRHPSARAARRAGAAVVAARPARPHAGRRAGDLGTRAADRRGRRAEALVDRRASRSPTWSTTRVTGCRSAAARPGRASSIPVLPFLALGLAEAWRRCPATTLVLRVCGVVDAHGRDAHLSADRHRQHLAVVERARQRRLPAHDPDRSSASATAGSRRAGAVALRAAVLLGARATGTLPVHTDAADRARRARRLGAARVEARARDRRGRTSPARLSRRPAQTSHTGLPWQIVLMATRRGWPRRRGRAGGAGAGGGSPDAGRSRARPRRSAAHA